MAIITHNNGFMSINIQYFYVIGMSLSWPINFDPPTPHDFHQLHTSHYM